MKITEKNVVQELRKRSEKALYFVIDQYGGLIKSIVRKHLSFLENVQEECMDDILLAIWNHIEKFDEEKNTFKNSYWRFEKLDDSVTKIILTPVITSGEEEEKKTNY